jgi:hypothetical protein
MRKLRLLLLPWIYKIFPEILLITLGGKLKFTKENAHFICNSKDHSNGDILISIDAS